MADVTTNFDAERLEEEIETGEVKAPEVNVEADYERSKEFAVSEIDRDAEASTTAQEHQLVGEQAKFKQMAREVIADQEKSE